MAVSLMWKEIGICTAFTLSDGRKAHWRLKSSVSIYFGYHFALLFGLGGVAADFPPQMRMIRILVPLATPPYIIAASVTPSGIMVVMSETDSTVDFVESVERNPKRGKKK